MGPYLSDVNEWKHVGDVIHVFYLIELNSEFIVALNCRMVGAVSIE